MIESYEKNLLSLIKSTSDL